MPNAKLNLYGSCLQRLVAPAWMVAISDRSQKRGCKIIVIDTRNTKTAQFADIHLAPKVGTDAALAMGIIRVLVKENLYDKAFVDNGATALKNLKTIVSLLPQSVRRKLPEYRLKRSLMQPACTPTVPAHFL